MKTYLKGFSAYLLVALLSLNAYSAGPTPPPGVRQTGAIVANHCVKWNGNNLVADAGANCGTGAGTVTTTGSPVNGDIAIFSSATAITAATNTGTGAVAHALSPVFVTPTLGASLATSINFGVDTLNYYGSGTFSATVTGAITGSTTVRYTKVGNAVNLYFPTNRVAGASAASFITLTGMPAAIRPTADVYEGKVLVTDNGTDQTPVGVLNITPAGAVNIYKTIVFGNFTSSAATTGYYAVTSSYSQ